MLAAAAVILQLAYVMPSQAAAEQDNPSHDPLVMKTQQLYQALIRSESANRDSAYRLLAPKLIEEISFILDKTPPDSPRFELLSETLYGVAVRIPELIGAQKL